MDGAWWGRGGEGRGGEEGSQQGSEGQVFRAEEARRRPPAFSLRKASGRAGARGAEQGHAAVGRCRDGGTGRKLGGSTGGGDAGWVGWASPGGREAGGPGRRGHQDCVSWSPGAAGVGGQLMDTKPGHAQEGGFFTRWQNQVLVKQSQGRRCIQITAHLLRFWSSLCAGRRAPYMLTCVCTAPQPRHTRSLPLAAAGS